MCTERRIRLRLPGPSGTAKRSLLPPSAAWQGFLRGPAHPAAAAAHVTADHGSLSSRGSGNRMHAQPGHRKTPGAASLRMRGGGRQAPPGGTADAVGEGRAAAARDHVRTTWRPAVRGPWPGRPAGQPTARVGGGSRSPPSAPLCPLTSDLQPHYLRVIPGRRSRGVFINRTPGGSETPDRRSPTQGNGGAAHAHPRLRPRTRRGPVAGEWRSFPRASLRSVCDSSGKWGPRKVKILSTCQSLVSLINHSVSSGHRGSGS